MAFLRCWYCVGWLGYAWRKCREKEREIAFLGLGNGIGIGVSCVYELNTNVQGMMTSY